MTAENSIQNVFVTGGAGYVGAVLVPKLLETGYRVKVLDWYLYGDEALASSRTNPALKEIKGDLRDRELLKKELKGMDAVIHLACISNDPSYELDPALGKAINYDAMLGLVDLAKDAGVKRFVYASSSSVYGLKKETEVTEELALEPLTDYSKYKALGEDYLQKKASGDFTVFTLRPATVCGYSPRLRLDLVVNIFANQALQNKKITIFGGGQKRPNIHIDDMAEIYVQSLKYSSKKIAGKIFNVGHANFSLKELAEVVKEAVGDPAVEITAIATEDHRSYHISSEKIRKELGFEARRGLGDAVRQLKKAFDARLVSEPLTNEKYYNAKMMQKARLR